MDQLKEYLAVKEEEWEGLCVRCGGCCGAYDDPCVHLRQDGGGQYFCDIYERRFGIRTTRSGEKFRCVPVREILHIHWKNDYRCPYKRMQKNQWCR
ncbi:MAG: hypothetical protein GF333_05970 [Candidatus Omnitrophica bacterium]|nr:hypothetical protein [Candidatus Omnitrophota bacterium]